MASCGDNSSGDPSSPPHTHTWGATWVVFDAVGTTDGFEAKVCTQNSTHIDMTGSRPGGTAGLVYTLTGTEYNVTDFTGTSANVRIPATFRGKPVTGILGGSVGAFRNNTIITSVIIPASVISIGNFYGCSNLTSVIIAEGSQVTTISASAFNQCSKLESVVIPASVTSIEANAFTVCHALTTGKVFYGGANSTAWGLITITGTTNNAPVINATRYYYSATSNTDGSHWRYVDGVPTIW